jgi:uncharacterized protein (DUF1697 family)
VSLYVALLRGINVGGKNKLPMKDLAAMFSDCGCEGVETYIQSGNVVFEASAAIAGRVPAAVAGAILKRCGYRVPVIMRTAGELAAVALYNPFLAAGQSPDALHVAFLAGKPQKVRAASLDVRRSPPDEFVLQGREVYLCLPNGVARTKLTNAYLDSTLDTTSTLRNWRTVRKLVELVER